jgi:hypothetical protein
MPLNNSLAHRRSDRTQKFIDSQTHPSTVARKQFDPDLPFQDRAFSVERHVVRLFAHYGVDYHSITGQGFVDDPAQEKVSVWRSWKSKGQEKAAHPHMEWGPPDGLYKSLLFLPLGLGLDTAFWKTNAYAPIRFGSGSTASRESSNLLYEPSSGVARNSRQLNSAINDGNNGNLQCDVVNCKMPCATSVCMSAHLREWPIVLLIMAETDMIKVGEGIQGVVSPTPVQALERRLRAIRAQMGKPLVIVTKRDRFLTSRVTDPKDIETVVVLTRPLRRNLGRISTEGANEVSYHAVQLVVLPSDKYELLMVMILPVTNRIPSCYLSKSRAVLRLRPGKFSAKSYNPEFCGRIAPPE